MNTWWNDEPVPDSIYESHRRRDFYELFVKVTSDREILTVRGPRQVGKTTIVGQMIDELLPEEVSRHEKEMMQSPHEPKTILYLNTTTVGVRNIGRTSVPPVWISCILHSQYCFL